MKKIAPLALLLCLGAWVAVTAQDQPKAPELKTLAEKASWAYGHRIGSSMRQQKAPIEFDVLVAGLRAGLDGAPSGMTEEDVNTTLQEFQRLIRESALKQNMADGEAYLAENKTKEGVITLPSGLQYKILKPGAGAQPAASDRVTVHYRGTRIDGTEFDSSYSRGRPATFPVTGVIKGWIEALQLMKVGAKWQLVIPSGLAYGANPRPGVIQPNDALVFEVELIKIEGK